MTCAILVCMTIETDQKTITLFAYGTLRTGERLHDWVKDEIIENKGVARVRYAKLFYSRNHKGYPYLVFTGNPSDYAVGELFEVPINDQIISMFQMEMNAGYTVSDTVALTSDDDEVNVVVCSWKGTYGDPVENNDWCSKERTDWWQ